MSRYYVVKQPQQQLCRFNKQEGLAVASIARDVVVEITPPRDHNAR